MLQHSALPRELCAALLPFTSRKSTSQFVVHAQTLLMWLLCANADTPRNQAHQLEIGQVLCCLCLLMALMPWPVGLLQ